MLRIIGSLLFILLSTTSYAQNYPICAGEVDGNPYVWNVCAPGFIFSNGTVTDNHDGTISVDTSGSVGSGWTDDGTVVRLTTASDNVGIGTTAPAAKLEINTSSGVLQRWQNSANKYLDINVNSSGNISYAFPPGGSANLTYNMDTDGVFSVTSTGANTSAGNNVFRISYAPGAINDTTGNNYDAAAISVTPTAGVTGAGGPNMIGVAVGLSPHAGDSADAAYQGININYASNSSSAIQLGVVFSGQNIPYEVLSLNDLNLSTFGGSGPNVGLTIDTTGNVGIGNSAPTQQLTVTGNEIVSGNIGIGYTLPGSVLSVNGNIGVGVSVAAQRLIVSGGNVGIGYTLPGTSLAVNGNVGIGTSTTAQNLDVNGSVNVAGSVGVGITSTEAKVAASNSVTQTTGTKSAYYAAIDHNAASDTTTETSIGMNFAATASGTHTHGTVLGVNGFVSHLGSGTLTQAQGGSFLVNNTSSGTISAAYGANYAFQISGSGNITNGIGLNVGSPVYTSTGKVTTVNFGVNVANQGNSGTANSAAIYIANQTGSTGLNASVLTEGGLAWFNYTQTSAANFQASTSGDANALFVKGSTDNVGIGNSAPGVKLDVTGSVRSSASILSTATTNIGWSKQSGANTACNTTCTNACVFGQDTGTNNIVDCADTTADVCICAGAS